jgi:hypothetical protein
MIERRKRMLADGLVAGVAGYLSVVIFFVILDLVGGRPPLHTAALLGEAFFGGSGDPAGPVLDMGLVLAFNGVHLVAMLVFAFFASWLMYETELHPEYWYAAFFLFMAAAVFGYAAVLAGTVLLGAALSPWLVASSGVVGALVVAGYLVGSHRPLLSTIRGAAAAGGATG